MTRVIIAGSRSFDDYDTFNNTLHDILLPYDTEELEIVEGGCTGADQMAGEYAEEWNIPLTVFSADWQRYGKSAGPIRNDKMARYASEADHGILIAFPVGESRGTRNMIDLAKKYKLDVYVVESKQ